MDILLKLIPQSMEEWAVAAAIAAVLGMAIARAPEWIDAFLSKNIDAIFAKLGPDEDWLFVQFLTYLERKYGPYANADKVRLAIDRLLDLLPLHYRVFAGEKVRGRLYELVTKVFEAAKERIEKEAQEHTSTLPPAAGAA